MPKIWLRNRVEQLKTKKNERKINFNRKFWRV